jgi:uncharacterized RDD family membrane protein YckC
MNWYYVHAGNSVGPVSQEEFDKLVQTGAIQPETLVWYEGMANWQPYSSVRAAVPAMAIAAGPSTASTQAISGVEAQPIATGNDVVCAECNRVFPRDSTIQYGAVSVCANCKPAFVQKLREGATLPMGGAMVYAGFWIRFGAKLIDGVILGVVIMAPATIFLILAIRSGRLNPQEQLGIQILVQFGFYAINFAYTTFFLGKFGATPGKMACSLKVVTADGAPISYARAMGRALSELVSGLVCYIGYIIAAFDREKRALHDHIANTRVVRK